MRKERRRLSHPRARRVPQSQRPVRSVGQRGRAKVLRGCIEDGEWVCGDWLAFGELPYSAAQEQKEANSECMLSHDHIGT